MTSQRILLQVGLLMAILAVVSTAFTTPSRCNALSFKKRNILLSQPNDDPADQEVVFVEPGSESEALSDNLWEEIEGAQPPKWVVMKEILGIGGFTYLLAALIVGMLSLNFFLGPGWLGQAIGIEGTGTFTETSPTLPDQVDLSADEFLF